LTAVAVGATRVDLDWDASSDDVGVSGYTVTRDGIPLVTVGGTVTAFSDTTVSASTAYVYSVTARDAAGHVSGPSNVASVTTPSASGQVFSFGPTDDATIDQGSSGSNFGSATRVVTDNSPVQNVLLRFDVVTGGCSIVSASLSLTVGTSGSDGSPSGGSLRRAANASWSESSVTWANAPLAVGDVVASLASVSVGQSYPLDVSAAVTGDGAVSFRLSSSSSDGARYFSKEGGTTQRPTLTVTCA
jgi:hypothetical protein